MAMQGTLAKTRRHERSNLFRLSYWVAAIFELMGVVPMLSPTLFGKVMGIPDFNPGRDYTYAMGIAAVFTLGWILLLIWADRKPVERKGVMLLTIAVFVGNMFAGVYAASSGFLATTTMVPSWIAQTIIIVLLAFSYREARKIEKSHEPSALPSR